MRVYDPRIGKFLSVDPLFNSYPYYTPYQFAGNKPIWATDLDGLEERYFQLDIEIGSDNQIKSVSSNEIEGLGAGWHMPKGINGIIIHHTPVGKYDIGDHYSINIWRKLSDGSTVVEKSTLFVPRKQTWFESVFSPQKSAQQGGGIVFTFSQASDGINGASSQNKFEPTAKHPDGQMESIVLILDAMSMAKNAIEAESLQVPEGVLESIESVKKGLDLFDAGPKAGDVIDGMLPSSNRGDKPLPVSHCKQCGQNHRDSSNNWVETKQKAKDTIETQGNTPRP